MSFFTKLNRACGSVKLENEGAVARDHLANERTFLAWLRTSLAFTSIGVAITQFFRLQSSSSQHQRQLGLAAVAAAATGGADGSSMVGTPELNNVVEYLNQITIQDKKLSHFSTILGGWFIATGVVIILLGLWRYFWSQHYLQLGKFPASRLSISITFLVTLAVS